MNKLLFTFIISLIRISLSAQDTIKVNFKLSSTPTYFNQFRLVKGISSPNNSRIDVFDKDAKDKVGIPINYAGVANPTNFNSNYVGITTYIGETVFTLKEKVDYGIVNSQFNEKGFIQLVLPKALDENKEYDILLKISLADNSRFATGGWGAYLSSAELKDVVNLSATIKPQVNFNGIIKEKLNWTELKARYKTNGSEKFITIGCFDTNFKTEEVLGGLGFGNTKAYYYITDITLIEIPPDVDNDGVFDFNDKCPTLVGLIKFDGCPDSDGDNIPDNLDLCPFKKGLPQFEGCPDTDGDGIEDSDDKCPTDFGKITNNGCPVILTEPIIIDEKNIQSVAKTIQFENTKDELKPASKNILDNLAVALKASPTLTLNIDNIFKDASDVNENQELNTKRASQIINYLISNGCNIKNITYSGKSKGTKNDNLKNNGGRRIEVEVSKPK